MAMRYLVEIRQEIITPVVVEAECAEDAAQRVLCGIGEAGDTLPAEPEIAAVRVFEPLTAAPAS